MRVLLVIAIMAVLGGCSTNSVDCSVSLNFSLDSTNEGDFSYFMNGQFVGVDDKGLQHIYAHLKNMPDGATVEISNEANVHYSPLLSGSALGEITRGSSEPLFDMWTFPVGDSGIKELVEHKKMIVVRKE